MSLEIVAAAYIYINLASKKKKKDDGGKRSCIIVDLYPVEVAC
jgi:hypothetical protein